MSTEAGAGGCRQTAKEAAIGSSRLSGSCGKRLRSLASKPAAVCRPSKVALQAPAAGQSQAARHWTACPHGRQPSRGKHEAAVPERGGWLGQLPQQDLCLEGGNLQYGTVLQARLRAEVGQAAQLPQARGSTCSPQGGQPGCHASSGRPRCSRPWTAAPCQSTRAGAGPPCRRRTWHLPCPLRMPPCQ